MGTKGKCVSLWLSMVGKGIVDKRTSSGGPVVDRPVWVVIMVVFSMTG